MSPPANYAPSFLIVVNGTELRHGISVDVQSLNVTDTCDRADSFSFVVRDRHPEWGRFAGGGTLRWMDSDLFDEGGEVEISMGYVNELELLLVGEITALTPAFPENGVPTLTVQGYSLYHQLQRRRRRRPFQAATDSGIAEEIARDMGLTPEVDATSAEHPLVSPNGATYASILTTRAQRIGYEVVVKEHTLYFQRPRYIDRPNADLTLEWGKDLRSFQPRLTTYNMTTEVTVRASQTSQGRGTDAVVGTATASDVQTVMGTSLGLEIAETAFGSNPMVSEDRNVANQEEANELARAQLEARSMEFITGRGSCIGKPALRARTVLELKGLGARFSGNYYVTSATHTIDAGGYRTDFEVKRNAR